MHAEILARREQGWVWLDERVPVEEAYDAPAEAVEAGLAAIEQRLRDGEIEAEEARELVADARFELGANEHHMGAEDSQAIEALADFEKELRS